MVPSRAPLTESQLDRLEEFLDRHATPADGMSLEMLDGFLHAVVGGPETILPSEWMPEIWRPPGSGHEPVWASGEDFHECFELLVRHSNSVAAALRMGEADWAPLIFDYKVKGRLVAHAQEWALGFLRGVELRAERWQALRDDAAFDEGWSATGLLAYGPADPLLKPRIRTQAQRDPLIKKMLAFVDQAAVYWMERYTPHEPIRRSAPKIGRNDPCPCGSGKKFKQCCGSAAKLH
jgi:uncharacterized protein